VVVAVAAAGVVVAAAKADSLAAVLLPIRRLPGPWRT
jgi:hypothetical protein